MYPSATAEIPCVHKLFLKLSINLDFFNFIHILPLPKVFLPKYYHFSAFSCVLRKSFYFKFFTFLFISLKPTDSLLTYALVVFFFHLLIVFAQLPDLTCIVFDFQSVFAFHFLSSQDFISEF
jgi:hypothetical protein